MVAEGRTTGGAGGFGLFGWELWPLVDGMKLWPLVDDCAAGYSSTMVAVRACAAGPKATSSAATMPASARPAATMVARIQPVDLVLLVVLGVAMMLIFLSLWVRTFRPADHNFPAVGTLAGSGEWWAYRLNRGSTDWGLGSGALSVSGDSALSATKG